MATRKLGHDVVVVVSAMGDTTDDLLTLAKKISANPDRRDLDMLLHRQPGPLATHHRLENRLHAPFHSGHPPAVARLTDGSRDDLRPAGSILAVSLDEKEVVGTLAHVFAADLGRAVDLLEDGNELWRRVAPTVVPLDDLVDKGLRPMVEGGETPIKLLLDPRIDRARELELA